MLFAQLLGFILFSQPQHDKGCAPANNAPLINSNSPAIETDADTTTDCSHPCRSRTRASCRLGGTEAISFDRRSDRDLPPGGGLFPPTPGLRRATRCESPRTRCGSTIRHRVVAQAACN